MPESTFGCLTKIRSMQLEESFKICVEADINCFIPYKEVKFSNIVPSYGVVSLTNHDFDILIQH